jgi:hypothetical protein
LEAKTPKPVVVKTEKPKIESKEEEIKPKKSKKQKKEQESEDPGERTIGFRF